MRQIALLLLNEWICQAIVLYCSSAQLRQARTRRYESAADVGLVSFSLEERYEIMQWWSDHIDSLLNRSIY